MLGSIFSLNKVLLSLILDLAHSKFSNDFSLDVKHKNVSYLLPKKIFLNIFYALQKTCKFKTS